jgi:hypothetical protein
MNMAVHPSGFSLLGSCSRSTFGSGFGVRGSGFAQNAEPNCESEHERRTEKAAP